MILEYDNSTFLKRHSISKNALKPENEILVNRLVKLLDYLGEKLKEPSYYQKKYEAHFKDIHELIEATEYWDKYYKKLKKLNTDPILLSVYKGFDHDIKVLQDTGKKAKEALLSELLYAPLYSNHLVEDLDSEKKYILNGIFAQQYNHFTYQLKTHLSFGHTVIPKKNIEIFAPSEPNGLNETFQICPLIDLPGFICTAALPCEENIQKNIEQKKTIEIQLNFFGTIDFASIKVNIEKGGPGQQTIKLTEKELVTQVNNLIKELYKKYPDIKVLLRIAGHSLGGTLAKTFTYSLQKAIAIQEAAALYNNDIRDVIEKIRNNINEKNRQIPQKRIIRSQKTFNNAMNGLERELQEHQKQGTFKNLPYLRDIKGFTVYCMGAPGVSGDIDKYSSILTYFFAEDFLRLYYHNHQDDKIPDFGESEYLSGFLILPNTTIHKTFTMQDPTNHLKSQGTLPFPGCNERVMVAHNCIFNIENPRLQKPIITNTVETQKILRKRTFNIFITSGYSAYFRVLKIVEYLAKNYKKGKMPDIVRTHELVKVDRPTLFSDQKKPISYAKNFGKTLKNVLGLAKEQDTKNLAPTYSLHASQQNLNNMVQIKTMSIEKRMDYIGPAPDRSMEYQPPKNARFFRWTIKELAGSNNATEHQRKTFYNTTKPILPDLIVKSSDFSKTITLLSSVDPQLSKLFYNDMKPHLLKLIYNGGDFGEVLACLSAEQSNDFLEMMAEDNRLSKIITNKFDFIYSIQNLSLTRCTQVCNLLKDRLDTFIVDYTDIHDVLRSPCKLKPGNILLNILIQALHKYFKNELDNLISELTSSEENNKLHKKHAQILYNHLNLAGKTLFEKLSTNTSEAKLHVMLNEFNNHCNSIINNTDKAIGSQCLFQTRAHTMLLKFKIKLTEITKDIQTINNKTTYFGLSHSTPHCVFRR